MRIAIFGSEGQLGCDVSAGLGDYEVVAVPHSRVDITDDEAVSRILGELRPDWVINCAAMTDVDRCESDSVPAFQINAIGARNVARVCEVAGSQLIHISTDYVFDGMSERAYVESDATNPLNVYGMSKLSGEHFVRNECQRSFVMRTSGLYGTHKCRGKGTNFVRTMLRLAKERDSLRVVNNEFLTPTYTVDLSVQLLRIVEASPEPGIYHATNGGSCSWFEFAAEIFEMEGASVALEGITAEEYGSVTRRPPNAVLENAALETAGLNTLPDWRDALQRYLGERESTGSAE